MSSSPASPFADAMETEDEAVARQPSSRPSSAASTPSHSTPTAPAQAPTAMVPVIGPTTPTTLPLGMVAPVGIPTVGQAIIAPGLPVQGAMAGLGQAIRIERNKNRGRGTKVAYDPKRIEFHQYCETVCAGEGHFKYTLSPEKVFYFMFYQSQRDKLQRGGRKNRSSVKFDLANYNRVMSKYTEWLQHRQGDPPEANDPCQYSTFAQYRAIIIEIHKEQIVNHACSLVFEQLWTQHLEQLEEVVKARTPRKKKENYAEKVDEDFAPYAVVEKLPDIEATFWNNGMANSRSGFTWLRHRFCILYSTTAILRCESLFNAELSDFISLKVKRESDVHQLFVLVMQIAQGK